MMLPPILFSVVGALLIFVVLWEAFETIVFPRRVTRRIRLTRLMFSTTWSAWKRIARLLPQGHRENMLSIYGPLSLLLWLTLWATMLIVSFGLLHHGSTGGVNGFGPSLYFSGSNFFTLGLFQPLSPLTRFLAVTEAGTGLGFLAIVIGYLPALNQSFSRREVNISLLDSRAGSPPTAAEMLRRHSDEHGMESIRQLLHEWERWSAELLESHLSYPVLAYFRSQHENQSWLAALTCVLDAGAFVMVGLEGACTRQAQLTFAMARHAIVDLCLIFRLRPVSQSPERLLPETLAILRSGLAEAGLRPRTGKDADLKLSELRSLYEPYLFALSQYFGLALPPWTPEAEATDNWQTSEWSQGAKVINGIASRARARPHFR
ncbi:MAG: hypothetical protein P4L43_08845 [Syntrophobacteraceae bacterium]|nr:hypothetical protein [Syntrophobacteraceae bacterium]